MSDVETTVEIRTREAAPRRRRMHATGVVGAVMVGFVLLVAFAGPLFAGDPTAVVGRPLLPWSPEHPLGTDMVGRDLLSRMLAGGWSMLLAAAAATALTYLLATPLGLLAAVRGGWTETLILRGSDVGLAIPPLLLLLLLVAALKPGIVVVVIAVSLGELPGLVRLIRAASVEVTVQSFVESARLNGLGSWAIAFREVLPNVSRTLLADLGFRFTIAILSIAAANYLGLGVQPPAADWGVMVSENQGGIQVMPWPVLLPGFMIALLTIGGNLLMDALSEDRGRRAAIGAEAGLASDAGPVR